jgi:hypothetical protein
MDQQIKKATTSKRIFIALKDSSVTTGAFKTGVTTSMLVVSYTREDDGNAGATIIALSAGTRGTWSSGGFVEKDSVNDKGTYELGLPNAALNSGSNRVIINIQDAASNNIQPLKFAIQLTDYDPYDAVRMGMSALPNAAAGAANGLQINGANTGPVSWSGGWTISNAGGDALALTSSGNNGSGFNALGNGSGPGMKTTGGGTAGAIGLLANGGAAGGAGAQFAAGPTASAMGLRCVGTSGGHGIQAVAGTGGGGSHGIFAQGSTAGGGQGIRADANGGSNIGTGFLGIGSGSGAGIQAQGGTTGVGASILGGSTSGDACDMTAVSGVSLFLQTSNGYACRLNSLAGGTGLLAQSTVQFPVISLANSGSGPGIRCNGGPTGNGAEFNGGSTSGDGLKVTGGAGTGIGFHAIGGTAGGAGVRFEGAVNGNGLELVHAGTGQDLLCVYVAANGFPTNFPIMQVDDSGFVSVVGSSGGQGVQQSWKFVAQTTSGDPGNGKFKFNDPTALGTTQIYISRLTVGNSDFSNYFRAFNAGDTITVQITNDASSWVKFTMTTAPQDQGGWWILNVTATSANGVLPSGNTSCDFFFKQISSVIDPTWTTPMGESYPVPHAQPTPIQALYEILSSIEELGIVGTNMTTYQRDGVTPAMVFALDDASNPTMRHRVS